MNSILLPLPPSTNRLFHRSSGKVVKTKEYRNWLKNANNYVLLWVSENAYPKIKNTPVAVTIRVEMTRRRDIDNGVKAILDCLGNNMLMPDDRWIDELYVRRVKRSQDNTTPHLPEPCAAVMWSYIE